jgi:hypothetical protein
MLTTRTPSVVRGIVNMIMVKDEELFFQAQRDGRARINSGIGTGVITS